MSAAPAGGATAAGGSKLRAWLEVLRAPLLLSPIADVLAGWCVARGFLARMPFNYAPEGVEAGLRLGLATLAGCCLLAAGMAHNAVIDLPDDRRRKPTRPLVRGDLLPATVTRAWLLLSATALAASAIVSLQLLLVAASIVAGTSAYHYGLKRWRVPGCVMLALLRPLDLWLGAVAALPDGWPNPSFRALFLAPSLQFPLSLVFWGYAMYMLLATLHASTDDEPDAASGVWYAYLAEIALLFAAAQAMYAVAEREGLTAMLGPLLAAILLLWAFARVDEARRAGSPPRLSGALLSNVVLVTGAAAAWFGPPTPGVVVATIAVVLLLISRRLLRVFPPT